MRRLLVAALVAAFAHGLGADASAGCDPKQRLCLTNCVIPIEPTGPVKECPR